MAPDKYLHKLTDKINEKGLGWFLSKIIQRFIYKKQHFIILRYDLASRQKKYKPAKRWYINEITKANLRKADKHFQKYQKSYYEYLRQGCIPFGAFEKQTNDIIGLACFVDKDFYDKHYLHFHFHIEPHQVYQFAGEVAVPYRNTAISIHFLQTVWKYWRDRSKKEVISAVDISNLQSIRFLLHLKFQETGRLITLHRLFGIKYARMSNYSGQKLQQHSRRRDPS